MNNLNKIFHKHTKRFISSRTKNKQEITKGVNSMFVTTVLLIIFLFIYYLGTINVNATLGYEIGELNIKISQLKSQKDTMDNEIDIIKSLDNISNDPFSKDDMEYINKSESLVIKESVQYVYNN